MRVGEVRICHRKEISLGGDDAIEALTPLVGATREIPEDLKIRKKNKRQSEGGTG